MVGGFLPGGGACGLSVWRFGLGGAVVGGAFLGSGVGSVPDSVGAGALVGAVAEVVFLGGGFGVVGLFRQSHEFGSCWWPGGDWSRRVWSVLGMAFFGSGVVCSCCWIGRGACVFGILGGALPGGGFTYW